MNLYYNGDSYFDSLMMVYIFDLAVFYKQILGFTNCIVGGYTKKEKELYAPFLFKGIYSHSSKKEKFVLLVKSKPYETYKPLRILTSWITQRSI